MATLESLGMGSGVLTSDLVDRLIKAERESVDFRLDRREELTEAKITAYGEVKSRMAKVQDAAIALSSPTLTGSTKASSSDESILTATSGLGAEPGSYNVEVVNTAKAHSIATGSYSSVDEVVGTGRLTFSFGELQYDGSGNVTGQTLNPDHAGGSITIDSSNNTLAGIRDAINKSGFGINATIVNDGSGYRLQLTSAETGKENAMRIVADDGSGQYLSSGLGDLAFNEAQTNGLTQTSKGEDAQLLVNGLMITRSSNQVDEVIKGVTLNLNNADVGKSVAVNVSADIEGLTKTLQSYVDAYNDLKEFVDELSKYDAGSQTGGLLMGDSSVRSMMESLRAMISQPVFGINGKYRSLTELGINTNKDNKYLLDFDTSKLNKAMNESRADVVSLLSKGGHASDGQITYMNESVNTKPGDYDVVITQLATQAQYQGSVLSSLANIDSTNPLVIDSSNNKFSINVNGTNANIELLHGSYNSGEELAKHIAQQINGDSSLKERGYGVTVAFDPAGRFDITSNLYGSASQIYFGSVETGTANTLGLTAVGEGAAKGAELSVLGADTFANGGLTLSDAVEFNVEVDGVGSGVKVSVPAGTYATAQDLEAVIEQSIRTMLNDPNSNFAGVESPAQLKTGTIDVSTINFSQAEHSFALLVNGQQEEIIVNGNDSDPLVNIQNALDAKFTGGNRVLASLDDGKLVLKTEQTGVNQSLMVVSDGRGSRTQLGTIDLDNSTLDFEANPVTFGLDVGGITISVNVDTNEDSTLRSIQAALNKALEDSGEFKSSDVLALLDDDGKLYFEARSKNYAFDPSVFGSSGHIDIVTTDTNAQNILGLSVGVGVAGYDRFGLTRGAPAVGDSLEPKVTYQASADGSKGSLNITLGSLGKRIRFTDLDDDAVSLLGLRDKNGYTEQIASGKNVEGLIDGVKAVGDGQFLRAQTGTDEATNGYYLGNEAWDFASALTINSSNNRFKISIDGVEAEVTVESKNYSSGEELGKALQKAINENATFVAAKVGVKVEYTDDPSSFAHGKFSMISASTGSSSEVRVTEVNEDAAAAFGFVTGIGLGEVGHAKSGEDSKAAGIRIKVTGGSLGERGTVSFVSGFGDQLKNLLSGFLNGANSIMRNRENAFDKDLENIQEERNRLDIRIEATEKRLKASFQYNDAIVARLNNTLDFLKMQFEAMANTKKK